MTKGVLLTIAAGLAVAVVLVSFVQFANRQTSVVALERALTMHLDAVCAGPSGCPASLADLELDYSTIDGASPAMLEQFTYRRRGPNDEGGVPYSLERKPGS